MATINWQQAMAGARERIWSPGGVKVRYVGLQCIGLRTLGVGWAISAPRPTNATTYNKETSRQPVAQYGLFRRAGGASRCARLVRCTDLALPIIGPTPNPPPSENVLLVEVPPEYTTDTG